MTAAALRGMLRRYPTGVCVVTAPGPRPVGLTVNSFASVSLDPPLVLWCLRRAAASRVAFVSAGYFAVNMLAADQAWLAGQFSQSGYDRFAGVDWAPGPYGVPLLDGVVAVLVCRLHRVVGAGDHLILLGEVEPAACRTSDRPPLLFLGGRLVPAPAPGTRAVALR